MELRTNKWAMAITCSSEGVDWLLNIDNCPMCSLRIEEIKGSWGSMKNHVVDYQLYPITMIILLRVNKTKCLWSHHWSALTIGLANSLIPLGIKKSIVFTLKGYLLSMIITLDRRSSCGYVNTFRSWRGACGFTLATYDILVRIHKRIIW